MIPTRLADTIERLLPAIEEYDLVVSGRTATAIHALAAYPPSHEVELTSRDPLRGPRALTIIKALAHHLATTPAPPEHRPAGSSSQATIHHDPQAHRATITAPATSPNTPVAARVWFVDPQLQPIVARPSGLGTDYGRVLCIDQLDVTRQTTRRWLARPTDLVVAADLGLITARFDPWTVWPDRTLRQLRPHLDALASRAEQAMHRLACADLPKQTRRRARDGLQAVQVRLRHPERKTWRGLAR